MAVRHRVLLRHCDTYDPDRIRALVGEGLDALGLRPRGRVLVKPNLVIAHRRFFPHAFTRPEFLDGVLGALGERADGVTEVAVGERSGVGVPTRFTWRQAGLDPVLRRHRARRYLFDEVGQVAVALRHPDRLRDHLVVPEPVVAADFFVTCPKFKAHPWTTVTLALKNAIGLQDDRHRLLDHDDRLDRKIADLQEVRQPRFVAIDAIIAGQERMLTPVPFPLHLVIMGDNPVAVDAVGCRLVGVDPAAVGHVALCAARGIGSLAAEDIEIGGDVGLAEARRRAAGFRVGRVRVETSFAQGPIRAYAGPPPGGAPDDYCWGGCPGALQEAAEILRAFDADLDRRARPVHVVLGAYRGGLEAAPRQPVVLMGDCAWWPGRIGDQPMRLDDRSAPPRPDAPRPARAGDIFLTLLAASLNVLRHRRRPVLRVRGCPVSVAEQTLYLSLLGGVRNPFAHPQVARPFVRAWLGWRLARLRRALSPRRRPGGGAGR